MNAVPQISYRDRTGFTLIEVLVTIVIIAILASVIIVSLDKARSNSRDAQRVFDMKAVSAALELYYADHDQYPTFNDHYNVPGNWANVINALRTQKYLARAEQDLRAQEYAQSASPSPLQKIFAYFSSSDTAYASSNVVQDPLYDGSNPQQSYGYMPSDRYTDATGHNVKAYQNYRVRAKLENANKAQADNGLVGMFLWSDKVPDADNPTDPANPYNTDTCNPALGYYCVGPADGQAGFDPGKPVIYLYPLAKTDVSVTIHPLRIDASVPAYGSGWHVTAYPGGSLVNKADGMSYPYLFWEGGSTKPAVDRSKGFVVATKDVGSFLSWSLAAQGLTGKEISDFIEYWQPRMTTDQPYVYVYYMPQADYDRLVPIEIVPAPQTLIRVYMLFKPIPAPIIVTPEILTAPKRNGFTAVEWGGDRSELQ